ncbi:Extracellular_nuclease [Hexamita inflata]|uniref:Extracellular nuclease n=1 Tax=Hexamita inflata TaxID=28002 RepID=A0AA86VCB6_9EUKA|nr:Extracellular nuclease [Hexamita inflata]
MLCSIVLSEYFPGLYGKALREELKSVASQNHKQLSYENARTVMYNYIYNNQSNNSVMCVYTGLNLKFKYESTNPDANEELNCEHTVPQSFFNKKLPMKSDLHHLRPTWKPANSARSNFPFKNIEESRVDEYYGNNKQIVTRKPDDVENWSKLDKNTNFEVRETQKGDTARAVAYFYVKYPTQAGPITKTFSNIDNLIKWDIEHPPTDLQLEQYKRVVEEQGNVNPFYEEVGLVARAYCDMSTKYPCSIYE